MRRITIIIAGILLVPILLSAQQYGEDDNLHIPPKLVVTQGWSDDRPDVYTYHSIIPQQMLLLPMVFFDRPGEWVIPERYQTFRSPSKAVDYTDTNDVIGWQRQNPKYHEVLNIVGYRMQRDTGAVVGLRGGYSTEPGEDAALARERALVVREYLQLVWEIDSTRLPILDPISPVDSADNILLQEEARRVEFVTEDADIFAPVRFSIINYSPLNLMMTLYITPNVEPDRVASIEIRILDQDEELLAHTTVAGSPDSTMYRLIGNWWYPLDDMSNDITGLLVEARLILTDGRYRTAEAFPISIHEEFSGRDREVNMDARQIFGTIPFFAPGDTLLNEGQKSMIREYVRMQDSANRMVEREGLFVVATGMTEISESPTYNRAEVDVQVMDWRSYSQESEEMYRNSLIGEERGMFYIYSTQSEEDYTEYDEHYDYESVEMAAPEVATAMEEMIEEESGIGIFTSDSLGQARARAVISFIRDSLDIVLLNPQLPQGLDEFRGDDFAMIRTTGISPTRGGDFTFVSRPEDRWYHRAVSLNIEAAPSFDMMKENMEQRLKVMQEYRDREVQPAREGE